MCFLRPVRQPQNTVTRDVESNNLGEKPSTCWYAAGDGVAGNVSILISHTFVEKKNPLHQFFDLVHVSCNHIKREGRQKK